MVGYILTDLYAIVGLMPELSPELKTSDFGKSFTICSDTKSVIQTMDSYSEIRAEYKYS